MDNSPSYFELLVKSGVYGALRGLAGLPLEHPLDCIKTRWQSRLHSGSALEVARNIYSNNGIMGFYAGAVPNSIRMATKQLYRWPLMIGLPPLLRQIYQHINE